MKKIENTTVINAPAAKVWEVLTDEKYYSQWYEAFGQGSTATGKWKEGEKIIFADEKGMGLIGNIVVFNPGKELYIKMKGILVNGEEDYDSPDAKGVQLAEEHYVLEEAEGTTTLRTSADMDESWFEYMSASWSEALKMIKEISEKN